MTELIYEFMSSFIAIPSITEVGGEKNSLKEITCSEFSRQVLKNLESFSALYGPFNSHFIF